MGYVYVYAAGAEDVGTTGLVGALWASQCEHEEIANGLSAITLTHPYDEEGRWKALARGNLLSAPVRVRTTPEIAGGQVVTAVEIWRVKATATKAERAVYSAATKGRKKAPLKAGTQVVVVSKGESRYKIKSGKTSGWIAHEALSYELSTVLDGSTDAIETVCPPVAVRQQLFRIQRVIPDTEGGAVTAYAVHISSDYDDYLTSYNCPEPLNAQQALDGLAAGCDWPPGVTLYTDIGDSRTSLKVEDKLLAEALLNPEKGFAARWGAELIRDDDELYFLRRAGRNRGVRIEHGKNLIGATMDTDDSNVVTAIKPRGAKKDGSPLYLTDQPQGQTDLEPGLAPVGEIIEIESGGTVRARTMGNYVLSPHFGDYPAPRCASLEAEDCTVEGKNQVTTQIARARMLEQAQRLFDEDKIDLPDVTLSVNFVELGQTVEYAHYKGLETVYLHDDVAVVDRVHGIEVMTKVQRMVWDCLTERVIEVELGNVRADRNLVYSWQLASIPAGKLEGQIGADNLPGDGVPGEKLHPDLQDKLNKAWADIAEAEKRLDETNAWLDRVDAKAEALELAVGENAADIAAIRIDAEAIRAAVRDAEKNLAQLEIKADQISADLQDAEGNINTLQLTATETSSTISDMRGSISSLRQDVNSVSSTVSTLNGQVASLLIQTAEKVAVVLRNDNLNSLFEMEVAGKDISFSWMGGIIGQTATSYGLRYKYNNEEMGYLTTTYGQYSGIISGPIRHMYLGSDNSNVYVQSDAGGTTSRMGVGGGSTSLMQYDSGGDWDGMMITPGSIYVTRNPSTASDRRLKSNITAMGGGVEKALGLLRPRMYNWKRGGRLSAGLVAQEAQEALAAAGLAELEMVDQGGPDGYLSVRYDLLTAMLLHGWQAHEREIAGLEARVARLEAGK